MKIGDIICRKDMPQLQFVIVGEAKDWKGMWEVRPLVKYRGFRSWKGRKLVDKDDERWGVV